MYDDIDDYLILLMLIPEFVGFVEHHVAGIVHDLPSNCSEIVITNVGGVLRYQTVKEMRFDVSQKKRTMECSQLVELKLPFDGYFAGVKILWHRLLLHQNCRWYGQIAFGL